MLAQDFLLADGAAVGVGEDEYEAHFDGRDIVMCVEDRLWEGVGGFNVSYAVLQMVVAILCGVELAWYVESTTNGTDRNIYTSLSSHRRSSRPQGWWPSFWLKHDRAILTTCCCHICKTSSVHDAIA